MIGTIANGSSKNNQILRMKNINVHADISSVSISDNSKTETYVGGLLGRGWMTETQLIQCAVEGKIISKGYDGCTGGLLGCYDSKVLIINDCYAINNLTSNYKSSQSTNFVCGGILGGGKISDLDNSGIKNSYFAGIIQGTGSAFISGKLSSNLKVSNCIFDKTVSGLSDSNMCGGQGTELSYVTGCKALTTEQMHDVKNFEEWDFDSVWTMGEDYPLLRWQTGQTKVSIENAKIELSENEYVYDGTAKTPSVKVILDDKELKENTDFEVSYENNIEVGIARVVVIGVGDYKGIIAHNLLLLSIWV